MRGKKNKMQAPGTGRRPPKMQARGTGRRPPTCLRALAFCWSGRAQIAGISKMDVPKACLLLLLASAVGMLCDATPQGDALYAMMQQWKVAFPSWTPGGDPCAATRWEGVTCDSATQTVVALNLTNRGLTGPIPSQIGLLASLVTLDLSNVVDILTPTSDVGWNAITGPWPQELGNLTKLETLYLTYNVMSTPFPSVLLGLTGLVNVKIDNANLTGPLPAEIGNLQNLQTLFLGNNSLTGPIPSGLTTLSALTQLTLWGNSFDSQTPPGIGSLTRLTYLNLHTCGFTGELPSSFGNLVNLQTLWLQKNRLTGPIPDSWQSLRGLSALRLHENSVSGKLPDWLFQLPDLVDIQLYENEFQGPFPHFNLTKYSRINLKCNFLTGPYPTFPQVDNRVGYKGNCFDNITASADHSVAECNRTMDCQTFLGRNKGNGAGSRTGTFQYVVSAFAFALNLVLIWN